MTDVGDLVVYICGKYPYPDDLSNARLTKLVYLADWESARLRDRQMTGIRWIFNRYGPWVPDVLAAANRDPRVQVRRTTNAFGSLKSLVGMAPDMQHPTPSLGDGDDAIVEGVIERTKEMYFGQFVDYVYSTYPVTTSDRFVSLDLVELAQQHQTPEPARPHGFADAAPDENVLGVDGDLLPDLRMAVHDRVVGLLAGSLVGDAESQVGEILSAAQIESVESTYALDVRPEGEQLIATTEAEVVVEGFMDNASYNSHVEADDLDGLVARDLEWDRNQVWVALTVTLLIWLTVERTGQQAEPFLVEVNNMHWQQ